jgi:hypothetical protein
MHERVERAHGREIAVRGNHAAPNASGSATTTP